MKEFAFVATALMVLAFAGSLGGSDIARKAGVCETALAGANCLSDVRTLKAD